MSLQNFKVLDKLGEGSFAKVYKAQRLTDNKIYAIKQIDISRLDEKAKQNTLNQIRFLASFQCRNIVKYYEAFFDQNLQLLCIVMEFAQGGDLGRIVAQKKAKAEKFYQVEIWRAFIGVMHGLAYIHERNILHRDVKPENIFVYNGDYKIGDLNVSKLAEQNLQQKQTQIGTPYYASPQIWENCPYDNKCDVWALGCVAYQMATLNPPFSAKSMDKLYYEVTKGKIKPIPKHYSNELANIINKCLQKQANKRPSIKQLQQNFTIKMYENLYYTLDELQMQKSKCLPLLKTITFEKGKSMKNVQLPQPNYEKEETNERKQKSLLTISDTTKNNNAVSKQNSSNDEKQKREKNIFENGSFNVNVLISQKKVEFSSISIQESSIQSKRSVQRQVECNQAQVQLKPIQSVPKQLENVLINKLDEIKKQRSKQRIKIAQSPNKVSPSNENNSNNQRVRQYSQVSVPKYMNIQNAHKDESLKLKEEITLYKKPILLQRKSNEKLKIRLQNQKQTLEHNPQNVHYAKAQQQQPKRRSLPRTELSAKKLQTLEHANSIKKSIHQSQKNLQNNNNENIIDYKNLLLSKLPHHSPILQNQKQFKKKTIIEQLVQNQQRVNSGLTRRGRPEEKLKQIQYQKEILEYYNGRNRKNIFINRELEAVVRDQCGNGRGVRPVKSYAYL